jgi:two-component system catabolic regulation response regulator CreB
MQVLLVEDEPTIADTVIYALESENLRCTWVSTGAEAVAQVREQQPDLVLLDIGLPDQTGFDVCRQLREISNVPILFLTSRHSEIDQVLGLELGADDYITKPFSPRILTARVRAHLRRGASALSPVKLPSESDLPIDNAEAQVISLQGIALDLSRYEYGIFALLLKHPGRVYSREQLMQQVWENPDESFDRTVDTHIKTIRQKIKAVDPTLDPIKTRRGVGYSYEVPKA